MVIISAPSGAGKTTLVKHLLNSDLNLAFSISATSRPKRQAEMDGIDYYFIPVDDFKMKIENTLKKNELEDLYRNITK